MLLHRSFALDTRNWILLGCTLRSFINRRPSATHGERIGVDQGVNQKKLLVSYLRCRNVQVSGEVFVKKQDNEVVVVAIVGVLTVVAKQDAWSGLTQP